MTEPTRKQIIEAYDAVGELLNFTTKSPTVYSLRRRILDALPPVPYSTMADVNWEHAKHFLTVAESTKNEERYIMLCPEMGEHIRCISEDPHRSSEVILREYLIPTDDKYRLNREVF